MGAELVENASTLCSAVSVEPAAGCVTCCRCVNCTSLFQSVTFSWILLFLFVILTNHQEYTLEFTLIVGCKFIPLLNYSGRFRVYEGRKHKSGSVKQGLYDLRTG